MKTKVCSRCRERKKMSHFYVRPERSSGYVSQCKVCQSLRGRAYRKRNPDKCNNERDKANQKKWRKENSERANASYKRWRERNPEKRKEMLLAWERKNPDSAAERWRKRRALKKKAMGWMPPFPEGILFGEQDGLCLYCSANLEQSGWHMDHKIPLSRGGKHDWNNVCLSCPNCNLVKHRKTATEFTA